MVVAQPSSGFELADWMTLSDPRFSFSRRPTPNHPLFKRGMFRMEEKPAPFTKTVKSAAPEKPIHPKT
jgi:hypothetical protein